MGRWEARLSSFLLLFWLSSLLLAESFTNCVNPAPLDRFWVSPAYTISNPYIYKLGFADFYSFALDNATESLGLENISLASWDSLRYSIPPGEEAEFGAVAKELSQASSSLMAAKEAAAAAHTLSLEAQSSAKNFELSALNLAQFAITMLYSPNSPNFLIFAGAEKFWRLQGIMGYAVNYPQQYASVLANSSDAYERLNAAAMAISLYCQEEYGALKLAGAGSRGYSGAAKESYFHAQAQLSPTSGFCGSSRKKSDSIASYFADRPLTPDFSKIGFGSYLQAVGGAGNSSTISQLFAQYLSLKEANSIMQSEYATAQLRAKISLDSLSNELESLQKEDLNLIGDPQQFSSGGQYLSIGSMFSGINRGLQQAESEKRRAEQSLSESQLAKSQKVLQDYLSTAIALAGESERISSSAANSLSNVRSSAQSAVEMEKAFAEQAISKSELKLGAFTSSLSSAKSMLAASRALDEAKQAYGSAGLAKSLGKKYAAYSSAVDLAVVSMSYADNTGAAQEEDQALQEISSLRNLLDAAQVDGLDVSYEREQIRELESLLRLAGKPLQSGLAESILLSVREKRDSVLLRLSSEYSVLAQDYCSLNEKVLALREQEPMFLPEFDLTGQFFDGCDLDVLAGAGQLKQIKAKLEKLRIETEKRLPSYISYLLAKNAMVQELAEPPVLGAQSGFSAAISTYNPSKFSYAGPISFSVKTSAPLYSSELVSGGGLVDAFPDKEMLTIQISGVQAGQRLSFRFEKKEQPAQKTASFEKCTAASNELAQLEREISFFASRRLPSLALSESAPTGASEAKARYSGSSQNLYSSFSPSETILQGSIGPIDSGQHSLELQYVVANPFSVSSGEPSYQELSNGRRRISRQISLENISTSCGSARVQLSEPFSANDFSATSLGAEKVGSVSFLEYAGGIQASFVVSPLEKGTQPKFIISYVISDQASALSEALAQAELQVLYYNRTRDILLLSQARLLSSQNRTQEALSLLSKMRQEQQELSDAFADYSDFDAENASAGLMLSSSLQAVSQLSTEGMVQAAAQLSTLSSQLKEGMLQAAQRFESGDYADALSFARKASAQFRSSLSALSWKSATAASDAYAAARKSNPSQKSSSFDQAQQEINLAHSLFSQGSHLESFIHSSRAVRKIEDAQSDAAAQVASDSARAEVLRSEFAAMREKTANLLSKYSSQYSALSSQSKRQLPLTPAQAQAMLEEADKGVAASAKPKTDPAQALSGANSSLQKLLSLRSVLESSLESLQQSAGASLQVAHLAESEAGKIAEGSQEYSQIQEEVSRAEGFYSSALYADSLVSSDRAIRAANLLLAKSNSGFDLKTVLLGAASLLFIAGAAWLFLQKSRKPSEKGPKRGIPKEVLRQENKGQG